MRKLLLILAFLRIILTACNQTSEIKITCVEYGGVELEDMTLQMMSMTEVIVLTKPANGYLIAG